MSNWFVKDLLGISCAMITWILLFYSEYVTVYVIFIRENSTFHYRYCHLIFFNILFFLSICSHFKTMFTNPGTVPLNNAKSLDTTNLDRCSTCLSIKPLRAHHCRVCQRCIKRRDHHCLFVNNCVGENNHKYFFLFTFYTCLLSTYMLIISFHHLPTCVRSNWTVCRVWSPPVALILLVVFGLVGFCLFLFTAILIGIQIYCIHTDTPGVHFYKGKKSSRRTKPFFLLLKIIFGSQMSFNWLNPLTKPIYFVTKTDERMTLNNEKD